MNFSYFLADLFFSLFGTTDFLGINMGFWLGMCISVLIVAVENIVFWSVKPKKINISKEHLQRKMR